jgi:hypothetical protein
MIHYCFYLLDAAGHCLARQDHRFADDLDALDKARSLCADHDIDIWQGTRRVASVKKEEISAHG